MWVPMSISAIPPTVGRMRFWIVVTGWVSAPAKCVLIPRSGDMCRIGREPLTRLLVVARVAAATPNDP